MNSNTIGLMLLIGDVIGLEIVGVWLIRRGKQKERLIYLVIGRFICYAAPIVLIIGILGLTIATLRHYYAR